MSAPAATARAVALPATRATWTYVDEARAHEVHLEVGARELVVRERAPGRGEAHEERVALARPLDAALHRHHLEHRLGALGRYWRLDPGASRWRPVALPPGDPRLDLRTCDALRPPRDVVVHHYHQPQADAGAPARDTLLAALPRENLFVVLRARFAWPRVDEAAISVLHAGLPVGPARSLLARDSLVLAQEGAQALVTRGDFARVHGPGAAEEAPRVLASFMERVLDTREPARDASPARDEVDAAEWMLLTRLVQDPRLELLHARLLPPGEEQALLSAGVHAIHRAVAQKRATVDPGHRHLLTLLEASLVARYRLRQGQLRSQDPEVAALRRLAYYL